MQGQGTCSLALSFRGRNVRAPVLILYDLIGGEPERVRRYDYYAKGVKRVVNETAGGCHPDS